MTELPPPWLKNANSLLSFKSSFYGTKFLRKIFGKFLSFMSFEADVVSFKLIMKPIFGSCSIDSKIVIIAASDGITNVPNATNTFPDEF